MENIGVYIHIPFCAKKCAYCDFYSLADADFSSYADALSSQIKSKRKALRGKNIDTVYIGGGTPSLIAPEDIAKILGVLRSCADVSDEAEISMEANPGTLDSHKLSVYCAAGINRLSMGLQSADARELSVLSRIHSAEDFENSFLLARMEGFDNINVDVMYALPDQSAAMLKKTLDFVISMDPEHISFYGLKIEKDTPFGKDPRIESSLPDEDTQVKMYLDSCKQMENSGYFQYEISNFSKKGYECRHNLGYWRSRDYIGFGPAAHSLSDMRMYSYKKDLALFLKDPTDEKSLLDEDYTMTNNEMSVQYVMLAMRTSEGVKCSAYEKRFGKNFESEYLEKMKPFISRKLIQKSDGGYHLSRGGMLVSNYILSEILDFDEK